MEQGQLLQLVERARVGDAKAFEELCRHKARDVLYLCTYLMGNLQDGEDAAQEVFIAMQKSLPALRSPEAFTAWLNRLTTNTCRRLQQQNRRFVGLPIDTLADELEELTLEFLPQELAEEKEKRQLVHKALHSLPFHYRTALILFYYNSSSTVDIAAALGTSTRSAEGLLYRARKALRKEIERLTGQSAPPPRSITPLGGALVLTRILRMDAAEALTEESLRRVAVVGLALTTVPAAVAATTGGTAGGLWGALGGWAGAGIATAVTTVATAIVIASSSSASLASPAASLTADPQPAASASLAGEAWNAEEPPPAGAATAAPSAQSSSRPPAAPAQSIPKNQSPPESQSAPESPGAEAAPTPIAYTGQFLFCTAGGEALPAHNHTAKGFVVRAYSGDTLLATAVADETGAYTLLLESEPQALQLVVEPRFGFAPLENSPEPNPAQPQLPDIPFTDTRPPTATAYFSDENGQPLVGDVNPAAAHITVHDATPTTAAWQVVDGAGNTLLAGGGQTALLTGLAAEGPVQEYTLVFTLTDAAGNTATIAREFLLLQLT